MILASLVLLALSLGLFRVIGFQFFPKADKPVLFVNIELPKGSGVERASQKLVEAHAVISKDASVRDTSATVGMSYPEIFTSRMGSVGSAMWWTCSFGSNAGKDPADVASRLRQSLADIVGVRVSVEELAYGPPVRHPILLRVFGRGLRRASIHRGGSEGQARAPSRVPSTWPTA